MSEAISNLIKAINAHQAKHRLPLLSRPKNGARHSYGSYRLPVLGNVELLALEMGNSSQEIIRDYREVVHPDRVPEYWQITPSAANEIEQLDFVLGA